jgi:hypothetical protein
MRVLSFRLGIVLLYFHPNPPPPKRENHISVYILLPLLYVLSFFCVCVNWQAQEAHKQLQISPLHMHILCFHFVTRLFSVSPVSDLAASDTFRRVSFVHLEVTCVRRRSLGHT